MGGRQNCVISAGPQEYLNTQVTQVAECVIYYSDVVHGIHSVSICVTLFELHIAAGVLQ